LYGSIFLGPKPLTLGYRECSSGVPWLPKSRATSHEPWQLHGTPKIVGVWNACRQAWCSECYIFDSSVGFHVYQSAAGGELNDEDADRMASVWCNSPLDPNKFHQARMRDHLMVPFECDLRWDFVRLNLPGSKAFDPRLPRVFKWCAMASKIAGDITRTLATPWHPKNCWSLECMSPSLVF
jgi:hypothetical protein